MLGIAEKLLRRFPAILATYRLFDVYQQRLAEHYIEPKFLLDMEKPWGFGGVLKPYQQLPEEGLITYTISIPHIEKEIDKKCSGCSGGGKVEDWECIRCGGKGRETVLEWNAVNCIAATLCVLSDICLDKPDKEWLIGIDTKQGQLLSVQTSFERDQTYIGATLSKPFGDYLRSISGQELPEVKAAIKSTYLRMFPRYARFGDFHFRAWVSDHGQLIIDVPGDACNLYVDGFDRCLQEASGPMKLHCHNVDGHHQQLTLLSGLAALSGMARKKLYP